MLDGCGALHAVEYHDNNVPLTTSLCLMQAFRAMQREACKINVPLYVAHGTADRCTSMPVGEQDTSSCPATPSGPLHTDSFQVLCWSTLLYCWSSDAYFLPVPLKL
jgi:hypothetical protein